MMIFAITLAPSQPSHAVDVPFAGTVASACALVIGSPGVFGVNGSANLLSSKIAGGLSGSVTATTTSSDFSVSVASPATFTLSPPGESGSASFVSTYQLSGATTAGETDESTSTSLNTGITVVGVDLEATRNTGNYTAGIYEAAVTVTCE